VLYGCETWYLTTREEYRLRIFQNMGLRKVFKPEEEKKESMETHEKFHYL
jgi:hypothetical protein